MHQLNSESHIKYFDDFGAGDNEQHKFLSNFYEGEPIMLWQDTWAWTNEALFAAFKADNIEDFQKILSERDPGRAKSMGRRTSLRSDWEEIKYDVMMYGLRLKFTTSRPEAEMLIDTGDALLQEGTYWHDTVWGTILQEKGEPGRNWLGGMLMLRRAELVAETLHGATHNTARTNFDWILARPASKFLRDYFDQQ